MNFEPPMPPEAPEPPELAYTIDEPMRVSSKTITIRGVDSEIYNAFSKKLKDADLKIGDAISKMMNDVLSDFDDHIPDLSSESLSDIVPLKRVKIQHHDNLMITKKDLVDSNVRISFYHIENLEFTADITKDIFMKYVKQIGHCDTVKVPKVLPKLIMLSKLNNVRNFVIYDEDE